MRRAFGLGFTFLSVSLLAQMPKRVLTLEDLHKLKQVGDPQCSPEGKWVAYTLTTADLKEDKRNSDVWMVSWDGKEQLRVTSSPESESSPKWSPDGRYLAFLSSRSGTAKNKGSQVWMLDRRGGEAWEATDVKGRLTAFEWSPDSKRLALTFQETDEPTPEEGKPAPKPKPVVIDRYGFKRDGVGYLSGPYRSRIYLFELATRKLAPLTSGSFEESQAAWSPDGTWIAFVSKRQPEPDRSNNSDIWVAEARPGAMPRQLTVFPGPDAGPVWSPDSKWIAYLQGSAPELTAYNMPRLAVVSVEGGPARVLTAGLDRGVMTPRFTPDSRTIEFLVTDDMSVYAGRVSVMGGAPERMTSQGRTLTGMTRGGGCLAALSSTDNAPAEVYALDGGSLRPLTHHNDELLAGLEFPATEEIRFRAKDSNEAHGLLVKPVHYEAGQKYPLLLWIHGGPNGQDSHSFSFERQLFAAHGYAVASINYRGSAGRGQDYGKSIFGDWGNKEVLDLLAGVDHVVAMGVADPDRLGVGGWSYGGILTDYLIASGTRFKAASSGAGSALQIAMYGVDQYIFQYDNEIGPPWKNLEGWMRVSYPFLRADRIKTPTLFMGGEKDFNVPIAGSEQMYQALRSLGVPAELVVYPGEFHGISRPSFQTDRLKRYLDWYGKYLKPAAAQPKPEKVAPSAG